MSSKKTAKPSTVVTTAKSIRGTIADLTKGKGAILVNGLPVDQPGLSALTRYGFGKEVGVADRPEGQRGPAAKIWEFPLNGKFAVALK